MEDLTAVRAEAVLAADLPAVEVLPDWWESLPVDGRRAVAGVVIESLVVAPKRPGENRLSYRWRL